MEVLDVMTANRDRRDLGDRGARAERPQGRRQQHAAVHPGQDQQARHGAQRQARVPRRRGGDQEDDRRQGDEGQPVRLREGVPRAGQPGADGVRHQGPAVGRRLADLPALEAQGADERQAPDPRGHRRRRQGRQEDRLRRRPAQPDRLRVLQRRRHRRPGARPDVPQGHRRRRQGRRPRARPHGLDSADTHHTANSFALDPGGALYFQEGTFHHTQVETPYGPPMRLRQRRRLPLRAADAEVRGLRHLRLRQPARPRLRPLGPGHRRRRHRRRSRTTRPLVLRPRRLPARSTSTRRRRSTSSGRGPAPASRSSPAGTSPRRCRANLLVPTSSASRASSQYKISDDGAELRRHRGRADPLVDRPELPPGRPRRSGRTARSTSSTGTTRSSATCSTTSATPAATATHGRIYRVTYEGRPLLQAGQDRRRADREAARPAQGARGPRALSRQDRAERTRRPRK